MEPSFRASTKTSLSKLCYASEVFAAPLLTDVLVAWTSICNRSGSLRRLIRLEGRTASGISHPAPHQRWRRRCYSPGSPGPAPRCGHYEGVLVRCSWVESPPKLYVRRWLLVANAGC